MTRTMNARVAGITSLVYLAAGLSSLALTGLAPATSVLAVFTSFSALVMGVTLYAITREQGPELALLGLICRVIEGIPGEGMIYFAVGNLCFSWLLLSGRMIPVVLARLGVFASVLLVVFLLLQRAGLFGGAVNWFGSVTWLSSLPMFVFELALAVWLIVKGVAAPARLQVA
jgi:uncharacterized protein DUF4386